MSARKTGTKINLPVRGRYFPESMLERKEGELFEA
jgi:hypothetical protein